MNAKRWSTLLQHQKAIDDFLHYLVKQNKAHVTWKLLLNNLTNIEVTKEKR